jgi:hypothetical protein
MSHLHFAALFFISFSTWPVLVCAGQSDSVDPDLPQPFDANVALPLLGSSPFTRALNLSDSLQLTGIAYVEGKPVATLVDKATNKRYLVSDQPNEMGWRLKDANPSSELKFTQVKLIVGAEEVTIHYNSAELVPPKKGYGPSKIPTDQEAIRNDENGKPYVKGSVYLSDADRERYYKELGPGGHDQFRQMLRDNREKMFSASPAERAAFAKQALEKAFQADKATPKK